MSLRLRVSPANRAKLFRLNLACPAIGIGTCLEPQIRRLRGPIEPNRVVSLAESERKMTFYVSYASATGKYRIHRSSCRHCQNGAVDHDAQITLSWSPALETLSEAESYAMRMFPKFTDKGKCGRCTSDDHTDGPYWPFNMRAWLDELLSSKLVTRAGEPGK